MILHSTTTTLKAPESAKCVEERDQKIQTDRVFEETARTDCQCVCLSTTTIYDGRERIENYQRKRIGFAGGDTSQPYGSLYKRFDIFGSGGKEAAADAAAF